VVQGVGFRPAVHRLASRLGLGGSLHNGPEGVRLDLVGRRADLECFLASLGDALPPAARLERLEPQWSESDAEVAAGFSPPGPPAQPAASSQLPPRLAVPRPAESDSRLAGLSSEPSGSRCSFAAPAVAPDVAAAPRLTISAEPAAAAAPLGIGLVARSLVADRAPCPACRRELDDPRSRRFADPFLSCCDCGPRYTIATAEPWRRAHTTLAAFVPCPVCAAEFADPANRRFHAETISCPACGPRLSLVAGADPAGPGAGAAWPELEPMPKPKSEAQPDTASRPMLWSESMLLPKSQSKSMASSSAAVAGASGPAESPAARSARLIAAAAELLAEGQILALQGVGGFQLLVDASNRAAVARLRRRKRRPARPFALLVADPAWLDPHGQLDPAALDLLQSPAAPIVLLPRRSWVGGAPAGSLVHPGSPSAVPYPADPHSADPNPLGLPQTERWPDPFPGVAPGSAQLGVMLPASPLHLLLVRRFGRPLVCTSGNRSGEPLCTDPAEARERLAGIADAFLIHDRPIARPLDDSVAQLIEGRPALLRRARGYAPEPLVLPASSPDAAPAAVLALGGDLKAAPALALGARVWLAPHLGDLGARRSFERFRTGIAELHARYGDQLERIAIDRHPDYLSHQIGVALALPPLVLAPLAVPRMTLPRLALQVVQHHAAHALAVVAEQGLEPPLLAFCADGLGYGEDPVAVARPFDGVHTGCSPPLWGGELLAISPDRIERLACLRPLPLPGGDRAAREPRRVALGLLAAAGPRALEHPGAARCRRAFRAAEWELLVAMVERGVNCPWSSSLGRLFDGVASLLGLCQRTSYEGEAGLRLQGLATLGAAGPLIDSGLSWRQIFRQPQAGSAPRGDGKWGAGSCSDPCASATDPFPQVPAPAGDGSSLPLGWLDWQPLLEALLDDRAAGEAPSRCALHFHQAVAAGVADLISSAARLRGFRTVVLAGGCFQNALLLEDLIARVRRRGLEPHSARAVPGNDGGLALGQVWACRRPDGSPAFPIGGHPVRLGGPDPVPMPSLSPATLLEGLHWRYAVKAFDPERTIPAELWSTLEESLVLTPSSYGLQPWKFLVVQDPALRAELRPASWNQSQITDCSHLVVLLRRRTITSEDADRLIAATAGRRGLEPTVLAGYRQMIQRDLIDGPRSHTISTWASNQVYIALGNLMTSAALLGVDTCPIEGFSPPDYDRILNLEETPFQTSVVCPCGYRAADDKYAGLAKVRYEAAEVIEHR
jgi:hydrogenase maturation protein HypF